MSPIPNFISNKDLTDLNPILKTALIEGLRAR